MTLAPGVSTVTARATDTTGNFTDTAITVTYNPPDTSQIITNIVVSNGKVYERDTLDVGQNVYIDRNYTFTNIPTAYLGQEFIRTANNDKNVADPNHLSFDLTVAATVYVAFDVRAPARWHIGRPYLVRPPDMPTTTRGLRTPITSLSISR